jgi:hypothetical protein
MRNLREDHHEKPAGGIASPLDLVFEVARCTRQQTAERRLRTGVRRPVHTKRTTDPMVVMVVVVEGKARHDAAHYGRIPFSVKL